MEAYLVLEDGSIFKGQAFGATGQKQGEVVFSTAMGGYPEALTDPALSGQILVCTYPLIGNCGLDLEMFEQKKAGLAALIVKEASNDLSSFRASKTLSEYLAKEGVAGLSGIDTRALTRILRNKGTMRGIVAAGEINPEELIAQAKAVPSLDTWAAVQKAAVKEAKQLPETGAKLALLDLGSSEALAQKLQSFGHALTLVPPTWTAEQILAEQPEAIVLGNGPGNPAELEQVISQVVKLAAAKPILGIGLGCQVLALALGAKTFKMQYGHRGAGQPVKDLASGKVYVTSQAHGYGVDKDSLPQDLELTQFNLNDETLEGFKHQSLPLMGIQYHPESGPQDSEYIFKRFGSMLSQGGK